MPSMRAPFAMIRPGYTPSSDPLEMMIETFSMVSDMDRASDAAVWLGDAADLRGELGGTLREELVQFLDRHAGFLAEGSNARRVARREESVAHESHDLPMLVRQLGYAALVRDLHGELLVPLFRLLQKTFGVELELVIAGKCGRHGLLLRQFESGCFPCMDIRGPTPGMSCPGSSTFQ